MASGRTIAVHIRTDYSGTGAAKAKADLGSIGKQASSAGRFVSGLSGALGDVGGAAGKAVSALGNMVSAFVTLGPVGTVIAGLGAALQLEGEGEGRRAGRGQGARGRCVLVQQGRRVPERARRRQGRPRQQERARAFDDRARGPSALEGDGRSGGEDGHGDGRRHERRGVDVDGGRRGRADARLLLQGRAGGRLALPLPRAPHLLVQRAARQGRGPSGAPEDRGLAARADLTGSLMVEEDFPTWTRQTPSWTATPRGSTSRFARSTRGRGTTSSRGSGASLRTRPGFSCACSRRTARTTT